MAVELDFLWMDRGALVVSADVEWCEKYRSASMGHIISYVSCPAFTMASSTAFGNVDLH